MNRELLNKAIHEKPLTAEETLALDQALEAQASNAVGHLVFGLESDAPNLEWRSGLNSKLAVASRRKQRAAWLGMLGFAAPVAACAAALAFWVMQPDEPASPRITVAQESGASSAEEFIVTKHEEAVIPGALGVSYPEETESSFAWETLGSL